MVAQVSFGDRLVGVSSVPLVEQPHSHASIQQTLERAGAGGWSKQARGEAGRVRGAFVERLEHAHRDSREHGLRAAEGVDQFHYGGWIGGWIGGRIGNVHREPRKWS